MPLKLKSRTSAWSNGHFTIGSSLRLWFCRMVSQASWSSSITARCSNPALDAPRARPPMPANNSTEVNMNWTPGTLVSRFPSSSHLSVGIPKSPAFATRHLEACADLAGLSFGSASVSKNRVAILATVPMGKPLNVDAKSSHERKLPAYAGETLNLASQEAFRRGGHTESQVGELSDARLTLASCPWHGRDSSVHFVRREPVYPFAHSTKTDNNGPGNIL